MQSWCDKAAKYLVIGGLVALVLKQSLPDWDDDKVLKVSAATAVVIYFAENYRSSEGMEDSAPVEDTPGPLKVPFKEFPIPETVELAAQVPRADSGVVPVVPAKNEIPGFDASAGLAPVLGPASQGDLGSPDELRAALEASLKNNTDRIAVSSCAYGIIDESARDAAPARPADVPQVSNDVAVANPAPAQPAEANMDSVVGVDSMADTFASVSF